MRYLYTTSKNTLGVSRTLKFKLIGNTIFLIFKLHSLLGSLLLSPEKVKKQTYNLEAVERQFGKIKNKRRRRRAVLSKYYTTMCEACQESSPEKKETEKGEETLSI